MQAPIPKYSGSDEIQFAPAHLGVFTGAYKLENGSAITFTTEQGPQVGWTAGDDKMLLYPMSEREFYVKLANASFRFDPPNTGGVIESGTMSRNTRKLRGTRASSPARTGPESV